MAIGGGRSCWAVLRIEGCFGEIAIIVYKHNRHARIEIREGKGSQL